MPILSAALRLAARRPRGAGVTQDKPCIVRPAARLPAQRLCAPERLLCSNSSIDDTTIRLPLPAPTPLFSLAHLRARSWHNSVVPERISAISKLVLTELIMIIQKCASQHWETSCISGNVAPNTATVSSSCRRDMPSQGGCLSSPTTQLLESVVRMKRGRH